MQSKPHLNYYIPVLISDCDYEEDRWDLSEPLWKRWNEIKFKTKRKKSDLNLQAAEQNNCTYTFMLGHMQQITKMY